MYVQNTPKIKNLPEKLKFLYYFIVQCTTFFKEQHCWDVGVEDLRGYFSLIFVF